MLASGPNNYNSQFTVANDGTIALTTTPFPIGGGTITGPVVIKTNTAPSLPPAPAGTLLQLAAADGVFTRQVIDAFGVCAPIMSLRCATGTAAAPAAIGTDNYLGMLSFEGYAVTGYGAGGSRIISAASQDWTASGQGAYLRFDTTPIGATTSSERMRIDAAGNVLIGTTSALSVPAGGTMLQTHGGAGSGGAVWAVGGNGGQGAVGCYDQTPGHYGAYMFSAAGYAGIGMGDNTGAFATNPINFKPNGFVGLGTNNPQQQLQVNGRITTTDSIWMGSTTSKVVPGANAIMAYGPSAGIWSVGSTVAAGSVGAYDETAGSFGAYLFSNNVSPGFALINNTGGYVGGIMTFAGTGGVVIGSPTGGAKGGGTINAVTVYGNNVVLTSAAEAKRDIAPLTNALPIVQTIEPRQFRWLPIERPARDLIDPFPPGFAEQVNRGFIAGEVADVLGGLPDGVDLGGMVAILWQAVRELSDRVAEPEGEPPAPKPARN